MKLNSFSGDCLQIHLMGCSCAEDRKVGGEEQLHRSAEERSLSRFQDYFLKIHVTDAEPLKLLTTATV